METLVLTLWGLVLLIGPLFIQYTNPSPTNSLIVLAIHAIVWNGLFTRQGDKR